MWHKQNKNRWKDEGTMNNQSQKLFYDCRQEIAIRLFFQDFIYFGVYHSIYASFKLATHGKKKRIRTQMSMRTQDHAIKAAIVKQQKVHI